MNEFPVRIQYLLDYLNIGASQLADSLGIQRSSISHLLSGRNKPGMEFMEKLALYYPSVSLEWFITGNGPVEKIDVPVKNQDYQDLFTPAKDMGPEPVTAEPERTVKEEEYIAYGTKPVQKGRQVQKVILIYTDGTAEVHETT